MHSTGGRNRVSEGDCGERPDPEGLIGHHGKFWILLSTGKKP